jgi:hypothetical protein
MTSSYLLAVGPIIKSPWTVGSTLGIYQVLGGRRRSGFQSMFNYFTGYLTASG